MKQKFGKLSFVRVGEITNPCKSHFDSNFDAIVDGTYSQLHGGDDIQSYCVYKLKNGKVVNKIAWYDESELTFLPNQDRDKAEQLIEDYNLRD